MLTHLPLAKALLPYRVWQFAVASEDGTKAIASFHALFGQESAKV